MTIFAVMFDLGALLGLLIQFFISKKDVWGYILSSALGGMGALLGGYIGYAQHLYPLAPPLAVAFSLLCGGGWVFIRHASMRH